MDSLKVLTYPHKILRQKTQTVEQFDESLSEFVRAMFTSMYDHEGCGLAAPQVGRDIQLFVMDTSRDQSDPICMVNPKIVHQEGQIDLQEGCLSFPGVYTQVTRAQSITVQFQDEKGKSHELELDGLGAHCVQHELDHLNGILFIDKVSSLKKTRLLKKLEKQLRESV